MNTNPNQRRPTHGGHGSHGSHGGTGRRPNIGITPDISAPTPESPLLSYELKVAYADAVVKAGGLPMVLAYSDDAAVIESYLDRISGLVVTGGAFDIPP